MAALVTSLSLVKDETRSHEKDATTTTICFALSALVVFSVEVPWPWSEQGKE
jgi:hypothetical protein